VFSSLSKTNFKAIVKDITANAALTTAFRWEDAQARAKSMAITVAGKGATQEEIESVEREFLISEAIQNYGADIVFGSMTRRVESSVKVSEKIPLIGGFEFIAAQKPKRKIKTRKEQTEFVKKGLENPYAELGKKDITDADLAPTKAAETVFTPEGTQTVAQRKKAQQIQNKAKEGAVKEGEARRRQIYTEIANNLKAGQKPPKKKEAVTRDPRGFKGVAKKAQAVLREFVRMDELADTLDGGKGKYDGVAHKALIDNQRAGDADASRMERFRKEAFDSTMKRLKLNPRKLAQKISFHAGYGKLTISELMGVYAKSKQRGGAKAVLRGNFKGDKDAMRSAIKFIEDNPAYKAAADHVLADYAKTRGRIADVYFKTEGKALEDIDYYSPLNRKDVEFVKGIDDIKNMLEGTGDFSSAAPSKAQMKKRVQSGAEVRLDLVGEWLGMVNKMEHYIHQAENVQVINGIRKNLGSQIKKVHGESMVRELEMYQERVANPQKMSRSDGQTDAILKRIRKNLSIGFLAFNQTTGIKQIPSLFYYMQDLGGIGEGGARLGQGFMRTGNNVGY
jgi:hypothetical protein